MDCFLCQKHKGEVASPPGGYIYEGAHWLVCHAPVDKGPLEKVEIMDQLREDRSPTRWLGVVGYERHHGDLFRELRGRGSVDPGRRH